MGVNVEHVLTAVAVSVAILITDAIKAFIQYIIYQHEERKWKS